MEELLSCTQCDLAQVRTRVVIGTGPARPRVMVIGEAPGRTEDEGGEPFIGASGKLFFRLLEEETGLTRAECFVTNVVKCRPPNNRTPKREEIAACRHWLDDQFNEIRPHLVVTLGLTAVRAVFGDQRPMGELHGQRLEVAGIAGVPTYHPAAALRQGPSVVQVMRDDLGVVKELLNG